jgi:branched-chain amino acid transport system ATP-binding protein/branched-chain amino acid transport system permease protein
MAVSRLSLVTRWLPEILVALGLIVVPLLFGSVDLWTRVLIWGLFGLGFSLLFGYTGLLSFGQAAFYGTGGFVSAYLLTSDVIANVWLGLLIGTLAAATFSVIVGYLALRRVGIYFAMITLAFGELSYFLENSPLAAFTGGENGLPGIPAPTLQLGGLDFSFTGSWRSYELIGGLFFVGYVLARFVVLSPVGSVLMAIRQNPLRAAAVGHSVSGYKLAVFVLAAGYAGLAGALLGVFQSYMPPGAFGLDTSGQLVIQTVIGGGEFLLGPAIGAAIWLSLRDGLQQLPIVGDLWKFILGFVFVLLVTLLRRGVGGELMNLWQWTQQRLFPLKTWPLPVPDSGHRQKDTLDLQPIVLAAQNEAPFAIETDGVKKAYGGIRAVEDVSFAVPTGALHAIIGPNGAGKSTFLRLLAGEERPDDGIIRANGLDLTGANVTAAAQHGIAKSFQINQLFLNLTVRQNLRIATLGRYRGRIRFDIFRRAESIAPVEHLIAALLNELGLNEHADNAVDSLPYGEKRRLELGLALASRPSVLLLDEPLAGLSPSEREDIKQLITTLRKGRTIVLVEHDMDAVFELAERIMVLHEGRRLAEGDLAAIQKNPEVQKAYLGGIDF